MKTQAHELDPADRELIQRVAVEIMGWTFSEKPIFRTESNAGNYFYWDMAYPSGRPIKATARPITDALGNPGNPPLHVTGTIWNPLTDPVAREEVIEKLIEGGCQVTLMINPKGAYCLIQEGTATISENAQAPTAGQAICYAAVRFCKTISEYVANEFGEGYTDLEDQAGDDYADPEPMGIVSHRIK